MQTPIFRSVPFLCELSHLVQLLLEENGVWVWEVSITLLHGKMIALQF